MDPAPRAANKPAFDPALIGQCFADAAARLCNTAFYNFAIRMFERVLHRMVMPVGTAVRRRAGQLANRYAGGGLAPQRAMLPVLHDWIAGGTDVRLCGHQIFCRQDGPAGGSRVTLLHGFPTSSHDWTPILPALTHAGYRVTTLDLLGFGASAKPADHDYRIVEQASIVEALWQHLGIGPTAIVAHDYSVSVAQELLYRDSRRITAAVFLNGGLYPDLHWPNQIQKLMHSRAGIVLQHLGTESTHRKAMREVFGRDVSAADLHDMWRALAASKGKRIQHRLLRCIDDRRTNAARWQSALENYPGPTMFVWGLADPVSGAHVLPRLSERLPKARIVVLDDDERATGHYPHVENPHAVAAALTSFLP